MGVQARIAVIGVGDSSRHDDGIGWAVIGRLAERAAERPLPPGTITAVSEGDPARLIGLWDGADLALVVEPARTRPAHPGQVHRLDLSQHGAAQPPEQAEPGSVSPHTPGLDEAVELSRTLGRLPGRLVVYGVEGGDRTLGEGLSDRVAAIVDPLTRRIEEDIVHHRDAAARGVPPEE